MDTSTARLGAQTLGGTANAALLKQLSQSIDKHAAAATFAVGGAIPILDSADRNGPEIPIQQQQQQNAPSSPSESPSPIPMLGVAESLNSPADQVAPASTTEQSKPNIHTSSPVILRWDSSNDSNLTSKLVFPLEPNTSGNLEQLVKDCQPATFGYKGKDIYDETYRKASKLDASAFSSTLNPYELGIIDAIAQVLLPSVKGANNMRGVRAELYKLNIYSGPSGKFQAHVDTPRSDSQFGSLVVCLPCDHEGGELIVRHKSQDLIFDWSTSASEQSGVPSIKWAAFYSDCEHEVLEVHSGHRITLTYNLYVSRGSGNLAGHCPWMDPKQLPLYDTIKSMLQVPSFMTKGGLLGIWCSHAYAHSHSPSFHNLPSSLKGVDMAMYEIFRALGLQVTIRPILDECTRDYFEDSDDDGMPVNIIGEGLHKLKIADTLIDDDDLDRICINWGGYYYGDVVWLSRMRHRELAIAYIAYGNDASMGTSYSGAALIIEIPPFLGRNI